MVWAILIYNTYIWKNKLFHCIMHIYWSLKWFTKLYLQFSVKLIQIINISSIAHGSLFSSADAERHHFLHYPLHWFPLSVFVSAGAALLFKVAEFLPLLPSAFFLLSICSLSASIFLFLMLMWSLFPPLTLLCPQPAGVHTSHLWSCCCLALWLCKQPNRWDTKAVMVIMAQSAANRSSLHIA